MTPMPAALPHWDMSVVYPSLESPEFEDGFRSVVSRIERLGQLFDERQVGLRERAELDDSTISAFESVINQYNATIEEVETLAAYIRSFVATDSRNNLAQAKFSELQQHLVRLEQLNTRLIAWIGSLDVDALIERSELAKEHSYALRRAQQQAKYTLSPAEEELASELGVTGGTAWAKLHGNLTSQLMVRFEHDGRSQDLPMSAIRNMAFDDDRDVRRSAYEAELHAWETVAPPLAAALNSIKGEVNTLSARRGWESPLAESLFAASIDQQTLDVMLEAAREAFPDFRRYLQAKARALGLGKLAWYDLFAPVGRSTRMWGYDEAVNFITAQFGSYSSRLSEFAARAFRENWIDAEPRPGKRDGAFCMHLRRDESRILSNYKPAFGGMSTLAHELGHAYHNLNLAGRSEIQRNTPMTLAETASIFCETIIRQAAVEQGDRQEQIAILEASLQSACQVVVDITSRFLFEQRVFEARRRRELSIDELNQLMLDAQAETYGDGLDPATYHPYMWAVKGHYYRSSLSFYNYPYMFGLLFGLGLYARYQQDPEAFKAGYDDLLSSTGLADAATLAERFGIDLRTSNFWRASFDMIRADITRFEKLIADGIDR